MQNSQNWKSMLAMWMSTCIKIPNVPKNSISVSILFPLKMPSLKNPDPGSLCKKWGVRVSHVEKPPVLAKKTFFATTRAVPFFSGNSKEDTVSRSI